MQLRLYQIAMADFNQARALDPERHYQKIILLDPKDASAHNRLAWLLTNCPEVKLRDAPGGLATARKAVELAPQSIMAWQVLGWAHYRTGDWKASIEALEKSCALQDNPKGGDSFQLPRDSSSPANAAMAYPWCMLSRRTASR